MIPRNGDSLVLVVSLVHGIVGDVDGKHAQVLLDCHTLLRLLINGRANGSTVMWGVREGNGIHTYTKNRNVVSTAEEDTYHTTP